MAAAQIVVHGAMRTISAAVLACALALPAGAETAGGHFYAGIGLWGVAAPGSVGKAVSVQLGGERGSLFLDAQVVFGSPRIWGAAYQISTALGDREDIVPYAGGQLGYLAGLGGVVGGQAGVLFFRNRSFGQIAVELQGLLFLDGDGLGPAFLIGGRLLL